MTEPTYTDPMGEGMFTPNPRAGTVYNGSKKCKSCDCCVLTPVQGLTSDECTKCRRQAAVRRLNNRMVD